MTTMKQARFPNGEKWCVFRNGLGDISIAINMSWGTWIISPCPRIRKLARKLKGTIQL